MPSRSIRRGSAGVERRAVIFADRDLLLSRMVTPAALEAARSVPGLEVVAVCDASLGAPGPAWRRQLALIGRRLARRLFDPPRSDLRLLRLPEIATAARRVRIPLLVPTAWNPNHPAFVERLRVEFRADFALTLGCRRIFEAPLLASFERAVNLHNALLPAYRGLGAVAWALYHGEVASGATFHDMTEEVDGGGILVQREVPVAPDATRDAVELEVARAAAAAVGDVWRALMAGAKGALQTGTASYFGARELREVTRVAAPEGLTAAEIARRLRAFGRLELKLDGRYWAVTRLREGAGSPGFTTLDGRRLAVDRVDGLPLPLHRVLRVLTR